MTTIIEQPLSKILNTLTVNTCRVFSVFDRSTSAGVAILTNDDDLDINVPTRGSLYYLGNISDHKTYLFGKDPSAKTCYLLHATNLVPLCGVKVIEDTPSRQIFALSNFAILKSSVNPDAYIFNNDVFRKITQFELAALSALDTISIASVSLVDGRIDDINILNNSDYVFKIRNYLRTGGK